MGVIGSVISHLFWLVALACFLEFRSFDSLWFDLRAPRSSENVLLLANFHFTSQTTKMSKTTPSTGL